MEEVKDKLKQIERKQAQAVELRLQLEKSVAIEGLWPGVFSADAHVAGQWRDGVDGIVFAIKRTVPLPSNMKTDERVFKLVDVPPALRATMPTELALRVQEHERKQAVMARIKGVSA